MTTTTTHGSTAAATRRPRGVFLHAVRSEWTKLWTVRSTYWTLVVAIVVTIGYSALISGAIAAQWDSMPAQARANMPSPLAFSLFGTQLGQLVLAVLGVLAISAEYRTGMIRSTFMAVPQRQRALVAKLLAFAVVAFVASEIAAFGSFLVGQAFFATKGAAASLGDEGVLRAVFGAGLFLTASGIFGLGIGVLIRNVAGSIAVAVGGLFVVPIVIQFLPAQWGADVQKYYPINAGQEVMRLQGGITSTGLEPWVGYGIFWALIAAILVVGALLLQYRDA